MMARKKDAKGSGKKVKALKTISFTMLAPEAQRVSLAGDFNNWGKDACLLKKNSKGIWEISISLSPGRYEYRFLVDKEWKNDPNCKDLVLNPFGSENSTLTVLDVVIT